MKYIFRRMVKKFREVCFKLSDADYPFEVAWCDLKEFEGENFPSGMKKLLAQFPYENRYYVIYIKKE